MTKGRRCLIGLGRGVRGLPLGRLLMISCPRRGWTLRWSRRRIIHEVKGLRFTGIGEGAKGERIGQQMVPRAPWVFLYAVQCLAG